MYFFILYVYNVLILIFLYVNVMFKYVYLYRNNRIFYFLKCILCLNKNYIFVCIILINFFCYILNYVIDLW